MINRLTGIQLPQTESTTRIYQDANGAYIIWDGSTKHSVSTYEDAIRLMATIETGEVPIEVELAQKITSTILPSLRELLKELNALQIAWEDGDMQAVVEAAFVSGENVVGFTPATWALWGNTFNLFRAWLETPQPSLGDLTVRKVVVQKYVSVVADTP